MTFHTPAPLAAVPGDQASSSRGGPKTDVAMPTPGRAEPLGDASPQPQNHGAPTRIWPGRLNDLVAINRSPLARKIIIFNLVGILVLMAGVLSLNPFRDSLVSQREAALITEAQLVAGIFETREPMQRLADPTEDAQAILQGLRLARTSEIFVFDGTQQLLASTVGMTRPHQQPVAGRDENASSPVVTRVLSAAWEQVSGLLALGTPPPDRAETERKARALIARTLEGTVHIETDLVKDGSTIIVVGAPIFQGDNIVGAVAITSIAGEIDRLVRHEREQVIQMFLIAVIVSIGLSLVLASTIANPLSDLADAVDVGRDRSTRTVRASRVRVPDLTKRPDEIGRLSGAMRGMVAALYDRIDSNEQFAADVAHEIKNPLASLRSAVGSLRFIQRDDHRDRLFEVIELDVRRLDRLVGDISNASRLDGELVSEEERSFNLLRMLQQLCDHYGEQALLDGIDLIADLPDTPILIDGLESRLAQVLVNLITNALSFCEEGDAVRVWARRRENRVLVVVEDTGPGIPDGALSKVFDRFYSERPEQQFGQNSGLGLAISKQIVEAHGGVIWAENIRPTDADLASDPLGARFVIGLPV